MSLTISAGGWKNLPIKFSTWASWSTIIACLPFKFIIVERSSVALSLAPDSFFLFSNISAIFALSSSSKASSSLKKLEASLSIKLVIHSIGIFLAPTTPCLSACSLIVSSITSLALFMSNNALSYCVIALSTSAK